MLGMRLTWSILISFLMFGEIQSQLIGGHKFGGFIQAQRILEDWEFHRDQFENLVAARYSQVQNQFLDDPSDDDGTGNNLFAKLSRVFSDFREDEYNISTKCLSGLMEFVGHLKTNITASARWALQMLDAQAKLPSGVLEGDLRWLGSYEQCRNVTAYSSPGNGSTVPQELFRGQYCLGRLYQAPNKTDAPAQAMPGAAGLGRSLSVGMCIPDSCTEHDAEHLLYMGLFPLEIILNKTDLQAGATCNKVLKVADDGRAIVAIVICSILAAFILLGTGYDILMVQIPRCLMAEAIRERSLITGDLGEGTTSHDTHPSENTPLLGGRSVLEDHDYAIKGGQQGSVCKFLLAFSLYTNAGKILSPKQGSSSLRCLNGIRFLSMSWVVLGHSYSFGIMNITNILPFATAMFKRWTFMAILNGTFSVDTFFFLSGLLVTYLCMREMERRKGNMKMNWAMYYFHRFWRLTPPYMLVLMFDVCLFRYLGQGPMWPAEGIEINYCKDTWWRNLLYINNFFGFTDMCMGWSWYLANDMQFFMISPLIVIPLYRSGKLGGAVILTVLVASFITTGVISRAYDMGVGFTDPHMMDNFDKIYITPYCRIGPYLVGMVVGYLLHITNCRVHMHKLVVFIGWIVAAVSCLSVLYGIYDNYNGYPVNLDTSALYTSVSRTVWALGLGWLVFACCTGYGGFVNTFLSWEVFIPLSRLTYCAYLVHPLVISYYFASQQSLFVSSDLVQTYIFLGHMVISYAVAFLTSLAFEAPFMGLEKVIFHREKSV